MKIAVNGFGRIGRTFVRTLFYNPAIEKKLNLVAINIGPAPREHLAYLFAHDSTFGPFAGTVTQEGDHLIINGHAITILQEREPEKLPWKNMGIDWVVEASGRFTTHEQAQQHLAAGASNVLISAPAFDADVTIIPGVNDAAYQPAHHHLVSLGSCTTNCFAPLVKLLKEHFTLKEVMMTTIHAYTNDQALLDGFHHDPRRARAAACNIVPTKTGADKVITHLFPEFTGRIRGTARRVPVHNASLIECVFLTEDKPSVEKINAACKYAADNELKGILAYSDAPLVSTDIIGHQASAIFDSSLTMVTGQLGQITAWYDNEYGYSCRMGEFLASKAA
jgi:glyceraldehyde 3-phosphate dehydrogenase